MWQKWEGMTLRLGLKELRSFALSPGTLSALQIWSLPWTPVPMIWEALCTWGGHLGVLWWSAQLSQRRWDFAAQESVRRVKKPPAASSPQQFKSLSRLWVFLSETPDLAEQRRASPLCPVQILDSRSHELNKSDCFSLLGFGVICYRIGNWNK